MSQDDSPDLAAQAGKVAPEAVALRAQPRPVTRLNRRTPGPPLRRPSVPPRGGPLLALEPPPARAGRASSALAGFDPLAAGPASTAAQPSDPTAVQNRQDQKEAFLKGGSTETRNSGNLQMPASPYQVMAGTVIAGALVTGIKSDLPGDVIATVTEPVYDTATGKFLLIPQGSRILGKYNSQVSYGQSRVQVVWNRVILPDTSSLKLDNLAGTDPAGYSGLEDGVDWHWDRVFAGAALTTLLGVGAELAAPENRQDGNRIVIAGRDSAQDSINQVGQEMTRRNMNIQPTLTERPGLPVRIIVNRDFVLRPYQPMFFNRGIAK
ncbi:TrbI/VirB10 family protein [Variovorax paradoxus]|uniref:TrbI/VirB10 family protein n=1 Tax=Variovorax paradoxus TaxID=34073 RepID=UPI001ABCB0BB